MKSKPLQHKKCLAVTVSILLFGVIFAGAIASRLATPKSENDYLHEHLKISQSGFEVNWVDVSFNLPKQDQQKIGDIISRNIQPLLALEESAASSNQTSDADDQINCVTENKICIFPIRINRRLKVSHLNKDFRVLNILETSLRVDTTLNAKDLTKRTHVAFHNIIDETRLFRFYQTQAGWVQKTSKIVSANPRVFSMRGEKFKQKFSKNFVGLNYYPASASWRDFWEKFPIAEIEADLEDIRSLNVNSLRIFLNHDYFDRAQTRQDGIEKLQKFLDLCGENNIDVLITLFDLRPTYNTANWAADIEHIDYVLSAIGQHEAVLGIDLKNQPDLDFENWGEGLVEAWLTTMARHIQSQFPDLAVTTGWSRAENAARLNTVFDVITYHEYQDPQGFEVRLSSVVSAVGDKPVMITELGSTTWHPPFIQSLGESAQASRLKAQLDQAAGSHGIFVWTLNDFDHVGSDVVGPLPWRQAQQRHFGVLRADGSSRPAAAVLKSYGENSKTRYAQSNSQPFISDSN